MNFSEEWKALWPIDSVFSPQLLISNSQSTAQNTTYSTDKKIGPLIFNPSPNTLTHLFTLPSSPLSLPPPFPNLSLPNFLRANNILYSTSESIAASFLDPILPPNQPFPFPIHNRLQLLQCPHTNLVFAFFPTGDNCHEVGFVLLSVKGTQLKVLIDEAKNSAFTVKNGSNHQQIVRLLANQYAEFELPSAGNNSHSNSCIWTVGYLLVNTMYAVDWYSVRIQGNASFGFEKPVVELLGSKLFKSGAIVHACWNPHMPAQSMVLIENGELFLFDCEPDDNVVSKRFVGQKVRVLWNDPVVLEEGGEWLACEFSWHPQILVVAHTKAVFLVDFRYENCKTNCLLKIENLVRKTSVHDDHFMTLCRAVSDGFQFAIASSHLLILCDVRKPQKPILQWVHAIDSPCCIATFKLSELRSHLKDDTYNWASESGYCILLGSFWNSEFGLFCYGPDTKNSVKTNAPGICKFFYAWELPSDLLLSARDCHCGSCLVREDFAKDALPGWIDWRQKKEFVLGFGILDKDLSGQLYDPDNCGGFMLIRLMSSGKLEAQRYCSSWESVKIFDEAHKESVFCFQDSQVYDIVEAKDQFPNKFHFLKFEHLNACLNDKLAEVLLKKIKKPLQNHHEKYSFSLDFHLDICQKLKACGLSHLRTLNSVHDVLADISLPTSVIEIAFKCVWVSLPTYLLRMAFSTYPEFLEVLVKKENISVEFLNIPDQPNLPPFSLRKPSVRSGRWSQKVQPGNAHVGPMLPIHYLIDFRKLHGERERLTADREITLQCNKVMEVVKEFNRPVCGSEFDHEPVVSLGDDRDEEYHGSQNPKQFFLHRPIALSDNEVPAPECSICESERFSTFIFKRREKDLVTNPSTEMNGPELFDRRCPIELKFNDDARNFGSKELHSYRLLDRQAKNFEEGFRPYQEYISKLKLPGQSP